MSGKLNAQIDDFIRNNTTWHNLPIRLKQAVVDEPYECSDFARDAGINVVLVDTAGRMQDNEPLMKALAKLIKVNEPHLVLFVGEALVGNEAVDQLVKLYRALADFSSSINPHIIDGMVLTKVDTIDDKVGAATSMTDITGQPIVFVGPGQLIRI